MFRVQCFECSVQCLSQVQVTQLSLISVSVLTAAYHPDQSGAPGQKRDASPGARRLQTPDSRLQTPDSRLVVTLWLLRVRVMEVPAQSQVARRRLICLLRLTDNKNKTSNESLESTSIFITMQLHNGHNQDSGDQRFRFSSSLSLFAFAFALAFVRRNVFM